jgi:hemolysin activation/secretion protein
MNKTSTDKLPRAPLFVPPEAAPFKMAPFAFGYRRFRRLGISAGLLLFALPCLALSALAEPPPSRPDAGQIFQESAPPPPPLPRPGENRLQLPPEEGQPAPEGSGGTLRVNGFRFVGNERISSDALLRGIPAIKLAVGTDIGLDELNTLADKVSQYYRDKGYLLATAYIPPQEVEGGIIAFTVLEGKIDSTTISGKTSYKADRIKRSLDKNLCNNAARGCEGVVLEHSRVDRALGIIADLPGIDEVTGTLAPGRKIGTSIFDTEVTAGPAWVGQLTADNYGNSYTGRNRLGANLRLDNPMGIGDRLDLDFITSGDGLNRGAFDYSLPVGYDGWRVGLNYISSLYTLGAPFDVADAHGQADALSAYASYPLIRSTATNLFFHAVYSYKWLEDSFLDESTRKQEQAVSLGLSGNAIDHFAGGGFTSYDLTLTPGRLTYDEALPADTEVASGEFSKLNYNLWRDQTLTYIGTDRVSLYGSLLGQWAWDNLDSVEKIYLGGPDGVRAYPIGEAPGDIGGIATLELRYSTPVQVPVIGKSDLTLALFRDQGWLTTNSTTWPDYNGPQHRELGGNGIALSLHQRDKYLVKLMWAARDRGGEAATSDTDADNRLWAQVSITF